MRVAILHDWLNQKVGGAENVLFELAQMYPKADIYTLVYNRRKFKKYLAGRKIRTSRLQRLPWFIKSRPKLLLPFVKKAVEKLDLSGYDLVISSSSAWVKNVNLPKNCRHICYCYSPARMLWDSWPGYIKDMKLGPIGRFYITRLCSKLRLWDYYKAQSGIEFIAISEYVAGRIRKFYGQPSIVIYPPVDVEKFEPGQQKSGYYLIISILAKYKNIELAIKTFKKNGKKLIIAGDGPDKSRLESLSSERKNIQFLGRVDEDKKRELLSSARGFIFPSSEDFGITMVESITSNTAVIAYRGGGAKEIVKDGLSGLFFDKLAPASLELAIGQFEKKFKGNYMLDSSYAKRKFSKEKFVKEIRRVVGE